MAERDEDRFKPRVGPPKAHGRAPKSRFVNRVLRAMSKAGGPARATLKVKPGRPGSRLGRGHVAAKLAGQALGPRARRVIVKTRLVNLKKANPRSIAQHLRYIERDGVTREGARGQLYGADSDRVDAGAFEERAREDRHQFRFIVSPEDAVELKDLKPFTRDLMAQAERDLGTRLDWVAVDHWDTDDPHTHIVVRGKDEHGHDLIIAPDYISHGMRARAAELATRWLGPRTDLEIRETLKREVTQERWTSLDYALVQEAERDLVTFGREPADGQGRFRRALLIGRLDRLVEMDLARQEAPLRYRLASDLEPTLRAMGERGDIIRTLQRAMSREHRPPALFDHAKAGARVVGKVAAKGLTDELTEQGYLVIDGIDGRAHYVKLPPNAAIDDYAIGAVVEVRGGADPRASDRNIAALAENGIYRTDRHRLTARAQPREGVDPDDLVQAHVRRLEALRRAGIVERIEDGVWRVPPDFLHRAQAYDAARAGGAVIQLHSTLPIEQQIHAMGVTWLDRQLAGEAEAPALSGFGAKARAALDERREFLLQQGLAERRGPRIIPARNFMAVLRTRELEVAAKDIEAKTARPYHAAVDGKRVAGVYRGAISLESGRFAILDTALGFTLVPWRPVIERRLGQEISAAVRGDFVSFEFGRRKDLSI